MLSGRGDASAKQNLVRHNLALVLAVARRQRRGAVPLDDIVQEGNVGLMRAVERFDPHAGPRFSTYAVWWIRAHVGRYLKEARSTVRPRSGDVALPDVSLDAPIGQDSDATHLDLLEAVPDYRKIGQCSKEIIRPEDLAKDKALRARLGKAARKHIEDNFNNEGLGREWEEALQDLTGKGA